ncbi:rab effector MyRIP-like [Thalassophryne amazonica]|uniref:rab effector MyRIP-like n=1 Tax=Thalassophryne amazonica TaxID=390379 RepID=UPI001471272F|nr:rab effector MyRIP-like [Thalassophryne amazonica]
MGRKLDLSQLTDEEAEHVMQVVQRDMRLRKKEEERLSELKRELVEEGSRCLLLSQQSCFNQHCCIHCCNSFTFLLNPRRQCRDCGYYVCKACRVYCKQDKAWICCTCQKSRLLKTQSLEWFYNNVKKRFKRFGSAKVLKTFYRKHLVEHSTLSELTDGSTYEESVYNEGSICGSDSFFYRQSEEHSMEEMFSVALRVAEEAIDEAISKANFEVGTQEQLDEAQYLQEHRAELIEQVAKTIVQKIVNRRKSLTEMKPDHSQDWIQEHLQSVCIQTSSFKHQTDCVGSHSAFSMLNEEHPLSQHPREASKKEGLGSGMTYLEKFRVARQPQSSDGNWIALQSTPLSRPDLLTKRKSLVYNALEVESGVVSPYEGMGSDNENKAEPDCLWSAIQRDVLRTWTDANFNPQDTDDTCSHQTGMLSPLTGYQGDRGDLLSDPEEYWYHNTSQESLLRSNLGLEIRRPSSSRRTSIIDVNFNPEGSADKNSVAAEEEMEILGRSHKERRNQNDPASSLPNYNKKDQKSIHASDAVTSDNSTPEPSEVESDIAGWRASQKDQDVKCQLARHTSNSDSSTPEGDGVRDCGRDQGQRQESRHETFYFSSTDDELDNMRQSDGEQTRDEAMEVHWLEKPAGVNRFPSTEDELHRSASAEGKRKTGEDEDWRTEELTAKVCRLANEISAAQFSSTEDELDKVGLDDDMLWKLQREKTVQAIQKWKRFKMLKVCRGGGKSGAGVWRTSAETMATGSKIQKDSQPAIKRTERQDEDDEKLDRIINNMLMMMVKEEYRKSDLEKDTNGTTSHKTELAESGLDARWTHQQNKSTSEDMDETKACFRRAEVSDDKQEVRRKRDGTDEERIETDKMLEEFKSKHTESVKQCASNRHKALWSLEDNRCRSSAESLRSITTEVLKVLNATEDMLQAVESGDEPRLPSISLPPNVDPRKLDQPFSRLEENVYIAAGTVCSLEEELSDLEECARAISSNTSDMELYFLEEQVATAAAKVQQSELQICDISARIAALKSAGLNVDPKSRLTKGWIRPVMPFTLDSSRHLRRRLPAPPVNDDRKIKLSTANCQHSSAFTLSLCSQPQEM